MNYGAKNMNWINRFFCLDRYIKFIFWHVLDIKKNKRYFHSNFVTDTTTFIDHKNKNKYSALDIVNKNPFIKNKLNHTFFYNEIIVENLIVLINKRRKTSKKTKLNSIKDYIYQMM